MFYSRPIIGMLVVGALLWVLSRSMPDLLPEPEEALVDTAQQWDPAADLALVALVQCLHDVASVTVAWAAALHPQAQVPNIEHWYRDRCQGMLDSPTFRTYVAAYGLRASSYARDVLEREAQLVVLAIDDPLVDDTDVVAFWRAAAGRAAVDLEFFGRTLVAVFAGAGDLPVQPLPDSLAEDPPVER